MCKICPAVDEGGVDRGQRKRGTKGGIGRERGVNVVNEDGKGGGGAIGPIKIL